MLLLKKRDVTAFILGQNVISGAAETSTEPQLGEEYNQMDFFFAHKLFLEFEACE